MECEMCGKKVGVRRHMVERTQMNLCGECSHFGTPLDSPAPAGTKAALAQNLEKRQERQASRDVFSQQGEMILVADYGPRVHKAREAKGWTHDYLGNKVSARVPELKQIESGRLRPSDDVAKRLERELGISLHERAEADPAKGGPKKAAGASLTIGDLLRDAQQKK